MYSTAIVNYHIRSAESQAFRLDVDGVIGKFESPELVPTKVRVGDVRDGSFAVDFDNDGVVFARHATRIRDFEGSSDWQGAYDDELRALLADRIGAKEVIVFDHTVRVDDLSADRRPARNVHNDYSPFGAGQRLIDILGPKRAEKFRAGHYGFVNVWRPVEHPIETSPLGFIRPSSTRPDDWMTIGLIYPDRVGQILGVAANADHDWFHLSRMTPDEVAIFSIHDNGGRPFLGHSALDMDDTAIDGAPRKSIESRTLVRYG